MTNKTVAAMHKVDQDDHNDAAAEQAVEAVADDLKAALTEHTAVSATEDRTGPMRKSAIQVAQNGIQEHERLIQDNDARIAKIDAEIRALADERRGLFRQNVKHQEGIHAAKMFLIGHGE